MGTVVFCVDGQAVPQGRPRFAKNGHAYDPAKSREYKKLVALTAKEAMRGKVPFVKGTALRCLITIYCNIPKSLAKKDKQRAIDQSLRPTKKPDIDNIAKAITDAMNGIVYDDDAQITELHCQKYYGDDPKAVIVVEPIFWAKKRSEAMT